MKNFLRRLKLYTVGFGIGLIFVFFFFQNRGCTWLPSNRVKNTILGRVLVLSDEQQQLLRSKGVSAKDLVSFLDDGEVNFGKSKKEGNPQVYSVTKSLNGKDVTLWFTLPVNSYISEIRLPKGSIFNVRNSTEGTARMLHFPNVPSIVFLDENKRLTCQQEQTGLIAPKQVFNRLEKTGRIDFSRSHFNVKPQPEHYIYFTDPKGKPVAAKTTWYQEHIQFYSFILEDTTVCAGK